MPQTASSGPLSEPQCRSAHRTGGEKKGGQEAGERSEWNAGHDDKVVKLVSIHTKLWMLLI